MRVLLSFSLLLGFFQQVLSQQVSTQPFPCLRWSGSVAAIGHSLLYFGGQATLVSTQKQNTWNNNLLKLDLSSSWPLGQPLITVLQPNSSTGPPAVSLGTLWSNGESAYQYGGELSDSPDVTPPTLQTWAYDLQSNQWNAKPTNGIMRVAEGSSTVDTANGIGYYFSGHLDTHTVQNWSNQIDRVYLSSLLSYNMSNNMYQNITSQSAIPVTFRADGTLTWIPAYSNGTNGLGVGGLLIAVGGATGAQYIENTILDIFDIATQSWQKHATSGYAMPPRVNHCAVLASSVVAIDTHQIFIMGGQGLNQSNRDSSVFILSIPSFVWTQVPALPSAPTGRAGHQCHLDGSQLIVIGGLISEDLVCDQPGIYIYDTSKTEWQTGFTAGTNYSIPLLLSSSGNSSSSISSSSSTSTSSSTPISINAPAKSNVGQIVGGAVGGIFGFALLILLVLLLLRRRRRAKQETLSPRKSGLLDLDLDVKTGTRESVEGLVEKRVSTYSTGYGGYGSYGGYDRSSAHFPPASDDVEDETRGMEAAFGSHLVPKQALRVTNPEFDY